MLTFFLFIYINIFLHLFQVNVHLIVHVTVSLCTSNNFLFIIPPAPLIYPFNCFLIQVLKDVRKIINKIGDGIYIKKYVNSFFSIYITYR